MPGKNAAKTMKNTNTQQNGVCGKIFEPTRYIIKFLRPTAEELESMKPHVKREILNLLLADLKHDPHVWQREWYTEEELATTDVHLMDFSDAILLDCISDLLRDNVRELGPEFVKGELMDFLKAELGCADEDPPFYAELDNERDPRVIFITGRTKLPRFVEARERQ